MAPLAKKTINSKPKAVPKQGSSCQIDEKQALELVMELMAIPGPSLEECAISEFVERWLLAAGVPDAAIRRDKAHTKTPLPGQTGNLIVKLPGTARGERVMLSAHLDTVPICVGCQPILKGKDKVVSARSTTGLGADNRAGVAVLMVALAEAIKQGLPYKPTTLCFFVQEEIGLQGSRQLQPSLLGNPKIALNFDGGSPAKMTVGATSGVRVTAHFSGIASHAGIAPQAGANALTAASLAIAKLHKEGWLGAVKKGTKRGTSNIGVIQGGAATNVVAEAALVRAEARSHDKTLRDQIVQAMVEAFQWGADSIKTDTGVPVTVKIESRIDYEAFKISDNSISVEAAKEAIEACGLVPVSNVSDGGVDSNWLFQHGIESVTLGCGQRDVHTTKESLDIPDFFAACRIALHAMTNIAPTSIAPRSIAPRSIAPRSIAKSKT